MPLVFENLSTSAPSAPAPSSQQRPFPSPHNTSPAPGIGAVLVQTFSTPSTINPATQTQLKNVVAGQQEYITSIVAALLEAHPQLISSHPKAGLTEATLTRALEEAGYAPTVAKGIVDQINAVDPIPAEEVSGASSSTDKQLHEKVGSWVKGAVGLSPSENKASSPPPPDNRPIYERAWSSIKGGWGAVKDRYAQGTTHAALMTPTTPATSLKPESIPEIQQIKDEYPSYYGRWVEAWSKIGVSPENIVHFAVAVQTATPVEKVAATAAASSTIFTEYDRQRFAYAVIEAAGEVEKMNREYPYKTSPWDSPEVAARPFKNYALQVAPKHSMFGATVDEQKYGTLHPDIVEAAAELLISNGDTRFVGELQKAIAAHSPVAYTPTYPESGPPATVVNYPPDAVPPSTVWIGEHRKIWPSPAYGPINDDGRHEDRRGRHSPITNPFDGRGRFKRNQ